MSAKFITDNCVEAMATMDEASVDAIVCDPPYELGFMGKSWDSSGVVYQPETWAAALRVLKPGGHLLAFGGTRTYHRLACAVEDAGFEIRDSVMWLYGSGFPKSLGIEKALTNDADEQARWWFEAPYGTPDADRYSGIVLACGEQFSEQADEWAGYGTALKPGHEPVVMARKPLPGTVVANVLEHGTGALNIDGCRIGTDTQRGERYHDKSSMPNGYDGKSTGREQARAEPWTVKAGRWPANLILSHTEDCVCVGERQVRNLSGSVADAGPRKNAVYGEDKKPRGDWAAYGDESGLEIAELWACVPGCPVAALDVQSASIHGAGAARDAVREAQATGMFGMAGDGQRYGDIGGASRFFYCAKASRAERNAGLIALPTSDERATFTPTSTIQQGRSGGRRVDDHEYTPAPRGNVHPTVKPVGLMRWLVRLVTPPGGTVLDPFTGSGTTGCAAVLEGFDFIGIERESEYVTIAKARVKWWGSHPDGVEMVAAIKSEKKRAATKATGQNSLFGE